MSLYNHKEIEDKWKEKWLKDNIYEAVDFSDKPKKYILAELPYPSGKSIHIGHAMRYTVPDIYSRYLRMKGFNVLFPMGWDAFGLPTEGYAIKEGVTPQEIVEKITADYKKAMVDVGYGIDWDRSFSTSDPDYYKWTQWLFLKMYEEGMAELKEMPVWWCEELGILADEEVLTDKEGGKISERGGYKVQKKMFKQWVLKIPEYAEKLLDGLDNVDFTDAIKTSQRNWIGKSEGAKIKFEIDGETIEVFTTRPDTIYGVTFMAIAPEHPLLDKLLSKVSNRKEVEEYILKAKNKSDLERQVEKEKTGVRLEGLDVKTPFTNRNVPLFVADYVLMDYGTGVVMGVPAHDERDFDFAKKFNLEIIEVIKPTDESLKNGSLYSGEGTMINCDKYDGMRSEDFRTKVIEDLEKEGEGIKSVSYKIRDWVFSRQRYWGEPIPLIYKEDGSIEEVCKTSDKDGVKEKLPIILPISKDYEPLKDGSSPLSKITQWVNTIDSTGNPAKRETQTMPTWAGSNWYFLRYLDPKNDEVFADFEKLKYWMPVDKYFGGAEHTTVHLLYSRFWYRFLYDQGLVPTPEPYQWRMNGGLMLGSDGLKMSKSRGNVVEPREIIEKYGADSFRMFICFLGPYDGVFPWNDSGIKSTKKLIEEIYSLKEKVNDDKPTEFILKSYNKLIKNVSRMIEDLKMNTCISEFMIFVNILKKENSVNKDIYLGLIKTLAPFSPFVSEEIWNDVSGFKEWKKENSIHLQAWPDFDIKMIEEDIIVIPVQVNGKVRGEVEIEMNEIQDTVVKKAFENEKIKKYLEDKNPTNIIYIKNRILNIII